VSTDDRARTDPTDEVPPAQTKPAENADRTGKRPVGEPPPSVAENALAEDEVAKAAGADDRDRQVEQLRAELEQAKDRVLRTQAELENYRKRVARQTEEERRYAQIQLIRELLPVWDNMQRAIEAAEKSHETASLLEGFKMVAGQLENVLERHHCARIDALGKPFDPNFHEAILQRPSDAHPANTVLQVAQAGFRLHDRVVRPSQVIVSVAEPETQAGTEARDRKPEGAETRRQAEKKRSRE
jgi:molecular chaperone GrpE